MKPDTKPGTKLTDRQKAILDYIAEFFEENNYPPTIREIGAACSISSTSVVKYNLNRLEDEKLIQRAADVSRGLRLDEEGIAAAGILAEVGVSVRRVVQRWLEKATQADRLFRVPIRGAIAAGEPIQVDTDAYTSMDEWVELNEASYRSVEKLFALRVQGDSMIDDSVLDGDIVVLRQQEAANGEMVAAWIEGRDETTLKHFYLEGNQVRLRPANPHYEDILVPADSVTVKGKVVSVIRQLE